MNRTRREENAIFFQLGYNILLLLILLLIIVLFIVPKMSQISQVKTEAKEKYSYLNQINSSGVFYSDFVSESRDLLKDEDFYLKEILADIDSDFYNNFFINGSGSYEEFLDSKILEYSDLSDLEEKESYILKILPTYSEEINAVSNDQLTDFKFINYLEKVLETFNLDYNNFLGINKTISIEKFNASTDTNLDSDIYYIPLTLDLTGSKKNILGFLYFIENVGNITIVNDEIITNSKNIYIQNKVLDGDKKTSNYNIFYNQLANIEYVSYERDIDSSFTDEVGDNDFISYLMSKQGNEKFTIRVDLRFYVKGVPFYKIKQYVEEVLDSYTDTQKFINTLLKDKDLTNIERNLLLDYNTNLKALSKNISSIKSSLKSKEELEQNYDLVSKYKKMINDILTDIEKQLGTTMK